ncbi:putative transcription factor WD40-like family [Lupinus albus]|uniref:Putative transcription factor WD40-like family n=1 Tax=Lupinus albus TaxID=3870 RepID=A0A6A4R8B1_LUPAL|nr:putative transcription factor WD40-like family [Lupinus albus]
MEMVLSVHPTPLRLFLFCFYILYNSLLPLPIFTSKLTNIPFRLCHQNDRKRQQPSSPEAANSTIGGNNVEKGMMMDGINGTQGLASSSNLLENIEQYEQVGNKGDNIESFQSGDGGDGGKAYGTINQTLANQNIEASKGFTFTEFKCIRMTNSKVTCCDFSSDEKFLASAGDDKKVVLWNMDTLKTENTPEEHKSVISDVRFRPNSSVFVTSCIDNCVRLWDAANPRYCLEEYSVHSSAVMSVDFHPKQTDLLCVSDSKNEIQYWNITTSSFINSFKVVQINTTIISSLNILSCLPNVLLFQGGNAKVRFQPGVGQVLAAAYDNGVSIFDAETSTHIYSLQGHPEAVSYICWDANGKTLASMSPNLVKIWSLNSGECVREYSSSSENQFHSCVFHPKNSTILVIGGNSYLELWNIDKNRTLPILAHKDIISSLVHSPVTGIVASASHDGFVKLWK